MNIQQIVDDMNNGVIVGRETLKKLADLALRQQQALIEFTEGPSSTEIHVKDSGYTWTCTHCGTVAGHISECLQSRAACLIAEGSGWIKQEIVNA